MKILRVEIKDSEFEKLNDRERNLLVGCMHAHNELSVLNRLFLFSNNGEATGDLADAAFSVQNWCLLQLLIGKLFETWQMLRKRISTEERPELYQRFNLTNRASLDYLEEYFGAKQLKKNALKLVRDTSGFHYSGLDLGKIQKDLQPNERNLYLSKHPANIVYFAGSALVFRAVFDLVAANSPEQDRALEGAKIIVEESQLANWHMHTVLYAIIKAMIETLKETSQFSSDEVIAVENAPSYESIELPLFIKIGGDND